MISKNDLRYDHLKAIESSHETEWNWAATMDGEEEIFADTINDGMAADKCTDITMKYALDILRTLLDTNASDSDALYNIAIYINEIETQLKK